VTSSGSDDADLVDAECAFNRLYDEHSRALHAYFLGRTGDAEAALDLLQEAFLRAWRTIQTLQSLPPNRWRYWLFAVARNLVTDHYRRRAAQTTVDAVLGDQMRDAARVGAPPDHTAARLEQAETMACLDRAIRGLPDDLRTALLLQVLGEMSSAQIGEMVGVPAGTVRYRIAVARRQLADAVRLLEEPASEEDGSVR
jgi:RNA polymerase sigma-70 factor (ECF subfamily)